MERNNSYPNRRYPRAKWHTYNGGTYFVTVCTKIHKQYFGTLKNGVMKYNAVGSKLTEIIERIPLHFPKAEVTSWVVMPNHFHLIIVIDSVMPDYSGYISVCTESISRTPTRKGDVRELLSIIIGSVKGEMTRFAKKNALELIWQPRFHEHIIRTWDEYDRIKEYIENNTYSWKFDCYYTDL